MHYVKLTSSYGAIKMKIIICLKLGQVHLPFSGDEQPHFGAIWLAVDQQHRTVTAKIEVFIHRWPSSRDIYIK